MRNIQKQLFPQLFAPLLKPLGVAGRTKSSGVTGGQHQEAFLNQRGGPGMATAGSGDVLTGVITALIGQGLTNFDAAVYGTYIHGLAGDIAAEKLGGVSLTATDIIDALPGAFIKQLQESV